MTTNMQSNPEILVELLLHLGRLAQTNMAEGRSGELSSAQWTALRYLDMANAASRTPSAFAKFHGTTRGTASQTIRGLIKRGYISQSRAADDGRSMQLDLTETARAIRLGDPFEAMVRAANNLPDAMRCQFADILRDMLRQVGREKNVRPFGNCTNCYHMECAEGATDEPDNYACRISKSPLCEADLTLLCVNFQPSSAPFTTSATT